MISNFQNWKAKLRGISDTGFSRVFKDLSQQCSTHAEVSISPDFEIEEPFPSGGFQATRQPSGLGGKEVECKRVFVMWVSSCGCGSSILAVERWQLYAGCRCGEAFNPRKLVAGQEDMLSHGELDPPQRDSIVDVLARPKPNPTLPDPPLCLRVAAVECHCCGV